MDDLAYEWLCIWERCTARYVLYVVALRARARKEAPEGPWGPASRVL